MSDGSGKKKENVQGKKRSPAKKLLILFIVLIVVSSVSIPAYLFFVSKKPASIRTSTLPAEIISFCFNKLPDLYTSLLALDEEIRLTQREIDRINAVGDTYPDQKKIAENELKGWTGNLKALTKCMTDYEKELQVLYVSFRVNTESGKALMDKSKEPLNQKVETVITQSKTLTDKLRAIDEARSFFEKTRDRLFNM